MTLARAREKELSLRLNWLARNLNCEAIEMLGQHKLLHDEWLRSGATIASYLRAPFFPIQIEWETMNRAPIEPSKASQASFTRAR